uniref:Reverse transcriptase/retrotransposon-derived protein RNase H-like domain-containing protein n=1 Tax=Tanacetum cinerariifolium TaxID=118510 RepID=A0A699HA90_TANCI|nr:hypothetical protein [Tanacetum cinerariifolium]
MRKFTFVFFDDVLVYNPNMHNHMDHLRQLLIVMRQQQLNAKSSKCIFGVSKVEYLSHIISNEGVATDPHKVQAILDWLVLTTMKQLRGFLGLTGYYRRFVKNHASISMSITALHQNAFGWNDEVHSAFETLKSATVQVPVLQLPDFNETFIIETDACRVGIGAVLQQKGHPIALLSKTLAQKHQSLYAFEKEFLAMTQALEKWKGYLLDKHFIIKTGHFSLKYLLDQRITTPAQIMWLPKLMGFDYEIMCKKEEKVWTDISMDFIDGLPMSKGRPVIMVIVDRLRDSLVDDVDSSLSSREATINLLKFHIKRSQDRMKSLVDKHRSERNFKEIVWVYLKLQPYRQETIRQGKQNKLSPKYFSCTWDHYLHHPVSYPNSQVSNNGLISEEPCAVLDRRMAKRGNAVDVVYVLIQWVNETSADAT